jgi:hypothetical protein
MQMKVMPPAPVKPYVAGSYTNPALPNTRQKGVPILLENTSGALLPSIGFVVEC